MSYLEELMEWCGYWERLPDGEELPYDAWYADGVVRYLGPLGVHENESIAVWLWEE
jgi:hypothetical protein